MKGTKDGSPKRVAVVHDWLTTYAGAERVLEQILSLYPEADVFAVCDFLPESERTFLGGRQPRTTFIQKLPGARKHYRHYLALMPLAIEQLDLSSYDLVISSSHAVAKGVLTGPDQLHVSYVYTPIRYAWDLQHQYLRESGLDRGLKGWVAKWMLHRIRMWDARTANGVDRFIADSGFIARRIWKVYRRDSEVIYPPVDVTRFALCALKEDFFLTASRMVPYKKMDLIVEAFTAMPERRLVVIGDGPEWEKIRAKAGPNVTLMGYQSFEVLRDHMQRARAFVFAAEEDFGITPLEAQACGTPVIAYGKGGALETVRDLTVSAPTGVFFDAQTVPSLIAAVDRFEREAGVIRSADCRANAERFSIDRFRAELTTFIDRAWTEFRASRPGAGSLTDQV
ncbi:glycosyl transferase family 1 [Halothiobacillus diazotrophicus]|uniref:Glycosyl transferase family 1 n=1 Tax=Halothiobacillus diazotrophicus TaxID=1860122 RepID=A0A191ZI82_9GAMM|nr:glycosyltransferase family 4 protein [Halothiobacillus diazotrophicus]ANJ67606.1 glycosyl transferase family 1 [Halothiobacillus diazotrophicus]